MNVLTPIDVDNIPRKGTSTNIFHGLESFLATQDTAAEVDLTDRDIRTAYAAYYMSIKRHNLPLRVIRRNNRLFIIKTSQFEVKKNK